MSILFRFLIALAVFVWVTSASVVAAPQVTATFTEKGLATLTEDSFQIIKNGSPQVSGVWFTDLRGGPDVPAERGNPTVSYEDTARRLSWSWPWGAIRWRYIPGPDRLGIELTVENDTAGPMSAVELDLLEMQFPRRPAGIAWENRFQLISDNESDITAQVADYQTGVMTFCNDQPGVALRAGFSPGSPPPQESWFLRVTSPEPAGKKQAFVAPRSVRTFRFSLRFSEPKVPLKVIAGDLMEKFAAVHPFQLKWPDRRPIGMLALSSGSHASATNPRGWLNDPKYDFRGPKGQERFKKEMFAAADRSIAILKDMGAQGMIFWNMEGEEFSNINYVGDPRMTAQLAPEMEAIAPEFFAKFIKAGLRTGVCIRPSKIAPGWDGKSKWQHSHMGFDPVQEMIDKITYAKKRLGCLLYYVDTNVRYYLKPDGKPESILLEGDAFKRVADAHPDVLIIPEIPQLDYWSCTAPYRELREHSMGGHAATDARVLDFYPKAFSVINAVDGPIQQRRAEIAAGLRRGDILLFRCWFQDEQNKLFKDILRESGVPSAARKKAEN